MTFRLVISLSPHRRSPIFLYEFFQKISRTDGERYLFQFNGTGIKTAYHFPVHLRFLALVSISSFGRACNIFARSIHTCKCISTLKKARRRWQVRVLYDEVTERGGGRDRESVTKKRGIKKRERDSPQCISVRSGFWNSDASSVLFGCIRRVALSSL